MNLQTINEFIEGIEAEEPTLKNCTQLAALYIVKKHIENNSDATENEVRDILPSYRIYARIKRQYANHEITEEAVVASLHSLCIEIEETVKVLYASTEMAKERKEIGCLIGNLYKMYAND